MKKLILAATIFTTISFIACNNSGSTDSTTIAKDDNAQKMDSNTINNDIKGDTKFAVTAADGGMTEVQISKLALTKSSNPDVTQLAQMMVDDHTKANDALKALAATKNITLPTTISDDSQKKYDKLSNESGKTFDKDYADRMVGDHKGTIDLFKAEADNGNDSAIKAWATAIIPTLEHHLEMADTVQARVNK
jgi:putative membrane protein